MTKAKTFRFDTAKVMGEDSYVTFRAITYDDFLELVANLIVDWDWVDDAGDSLPVPADKNDFDGLFPLEVDYLCKLLAEYIASQYK